MVLTFLLLVLLAVSAGFLGALLGLGGGIIIIPGLTLLFHYDMKTAIAASIVTVIATSSSAASVYVSERLTNVRLGMLLEVATTSGALAGAFVAVYISGRYLFLIFAALMIYSGISMVWKKNPHDEPVVEGSGSDLDSFYIDPSSGRKVSYAVRNVPFGMLGSAVAGVVSGLLGVGGGIIKVPIMHLVMRVPMKAAVATSNFMIGVTAAASAMVYWSKGFVNPAVAAPCVIGVLLGARLGTRAAGRVRSRTLSIIFAVFVAITAVQMIMKGLN